MLLLMLQVLEVATDATATEAPASLRELNKEDFYPFLAESKTLVIVDFYTGAWSTPSSVFLTSAPLSGRTS
jgi:hypothetical protein